MNFNEVKVVLMGTPEFAVPIFEIVRKFFKVIAVVSQPDKPVGRKQEVVYTPTKK